MNNTTGQAEVGTMDNPMKSPSEMTDYELRVEVSRLCDTLPPSVACYGVEGVPDYSRDLNAMHEAELFLQKEIGPMDWLDYVDILRRRSTDWGGANAEVSATARQRAEAFVLAMRGTKP